MVSSTWPQQLRKEEEHDWDVINTKRLMCMLRHVSQARRLKRGWVAEISSPTIGDMMVPAGEPKPGFYGWDSELCKAWRQMPDGPVEYACEVYAGAGAHDSDPALANIYDGDINEITAITVQDLVEMNQPVLKRPAASPSTSTSNSAWTRLHNSGEMLSVKRKMDRERITMLMLGKRQVCMVKDALFTDMASAVAFMTDVGNKMVDESTPLEDLYVLRNSMLNDRGLEVPTRGRKRATTAEGSSKPRKRPCADEGEVVDATTPNDDDEDAEESDIEFFLTTDVAPNFELDFNPP